MLHQEPKKRGRRRQASPNVFQLAVCWQLLGKRIDLPPPSIYELSESTGKVFEVFNENSVLQMDGESSRIVFSGEFLKLKNNELVADEG